MVKITKLFKEMKLNSIVLLLIIAVGILLLSISGCISPEPYESNALNPEITGTQTPEITQLPAVTKSAETYKGGPISIEGDDEFTAAKGVVRGSGTQADPYIIEGWTIDLSSYGSEYEKYGVITGISISRTTKYFVIRNCRVENGGYNSGISLGSVSNGKIENCVLRNNSDGISIGGSDNIIISGNTVENNRRNGISFGSYSSDNVTISNNIITDNAETGIDFHYLTNSYALNNTIRNNQENGIRIKSSSTSTISNNIVQGNKFTGIDVSYGGLEGGDKNIISYNDVSGNGNEGIWVFGSYDTITHNTVNGNDWGIRLDSVGLTDITAGNNIISYNVASNNKNAGISTCTSCTGNTVSDNTALSNNAVKEYYADGSPKSYDIQIDNELNTLNNNVYGTIYIYKR